MPSTHGIHELKKQITLRPSIIPDQKNVKFTHLPFFQKGNKLPSPKEVRAQAKAQNEAGFNPDKRRTFNPEGPNRRPPPVIFKSMNLFVKWGTTVRITEGQSLFAVNNLLKQSVPAPAIYGWRTDGEEVFLYMELLSGQTLEKLWDTIDKVERLKICHELKAIYNNLRQLEQDPADTFIGNVARANLYDRAINENYMREAGPFSSVKEFHDWFIFLCRRPMPDPYSVPIEPFRQDLFDDALIKFIHGDLHRSNIIVSQSKPYHIIGIVDWEQSGWLPEYWEDCKARYTTLHGEDWAENYLPRILKRYESAYEAWNWYAMSMGC